MNGGRRLLGALTVILAGLLAPVMVAAEVLNLGILAYRAAPLLERQYQPLADYLGDRLGTEVRLQVLTRERIDEALARNQLDLLLTSPGHFLLIRSERSLTGVLATMIHREGEVTTSSLGGVIIVRSDNDRIRNLADLANATIAYPGSHYLGGFQAQVFELLESGIDIRRSARLRALGTHDRVVRAVIDGDASVGFVRTGMLEKLQAENSLRMDELTVVHTQNLGEFPFAVSTRLYPEWPFVALPHVNQQLVRRLASALFALEADHPAVQASDIAGFAPPADYQSVEAMARSLRLPPYDQVPQVTWMDVLRQYRSWLVAVTLLLALLSLTSVWLWRQRKRLRREQRRLARIVGMWPEPMLIIRDGRLEECNAAARRLLGIYDRRRLDSYSLASLSPEQQPDGQMSSVKAAALEGQVLAGVVQSCEWLLRRAGDGDLFVDMTLALVGDEPGDVPAILCALHDITRRKEAEAEQRLAANVFSHAREGIYITDVDGRIIDVNQAFEQFTGYKRAEALGKLAELPEEGASVLMFARTHGHWRGEFASRRQDGSQFIKALTVIAVRGEGDRLDHFVGMFSDVTRLREQERKLTQMAHYDALTGLPNRVLLADRLRQGMALARRQGYRLAAAYIDLDRFKPVNDAFGHDAGDQLLVQVAGRMRSALRDQDTLARLGGDEFVAVIVDVPEGEHFDALLSRLLSVIREPSWVAGHSLQVSASIGVAILAPDQELDGDELLREADQAMYRAKKLGKDRYAVAIGTGPADSGSPAGQ